jgi:hypothetical protein
MTQLLQSSNNDEDEANTEDVDDNERVDRPLLNGSKSIDQLNHDSKLKSLGRLRAYWFGIVVCMGGFLCSCLTYSTT